MLILNYLDKPAQLIVLLLAIALAIGVHEAAHAATAAKLGDSTAKDMGRTNINPLVHLDPIGSILFLLVGFGWGKPVPVDERNLKSRHDILWVALAGPASNIIVAVILGLVMRFVMVSPDILFVLSIFVSINLSLAVFNMIPIPPLDGSKVLRYFVGDATYAVLEQNSLYLIIGIFILLNIGLATWLFYIVEWLFRLIVGA